MSIFCCLALLIIIRTSLAQDIVLKSSFLWPGPAEFPEYFISSRPYPDIDVDNDGNMEVFGYLGYFSPSTLQRYPIPFAAGGYPQGLESHPNPIIGRMRQQGLAEYISASDINGWGPRGLRIHDVLTSDLLLTCVECTGNIVYDYDNDGLDDVLTVVSSENAVRVYGAANGRAVSPPQNLAIRSAGTDYEISWNSVPGATAYRILWSSSIDGISFTRIGYTTDTSFVHRNRASEPMGFYRVMSEDNGTGVVRIVGQSDRGSR